MGVVYRGRQEPLGRPVALKVLADQVAGDPAVVQRFEKEALAVSRLNHPNIVTVYEFGRTDDGLLFLAMELLEGESLYARLKRGPLATDDALEVTTQVARALAEAHAQGIVHRDLKPENVMLGSGRDGELVVKVLDFGLAKMVGAEQGAAPLTSASVIMGTPGYMSPEQIHARPLDARTDLYSLGVVWWEMLVGRQPFAGQTPIELLVKHLQQELPRPTQVRPQLSLSPGMERLVLRLGAKDPNERPDDGAALLGELRALRDDSWTVSRSGDPLPGGGEADWNEAFAGLDASAEGKPEPSEPSASASPESQTESFAAWEIPSSEAQAPGRLPPAPAAASSPAVPAGGTQRFAVPPPTNPETSNQLATAAAPAPAVPVPAPSPPPPTSPSVAAASASSSLTSWPPTDKTPEPSWPPAAKPAVEAPVPTSSPPPGLSSQLPSPQAPSPPAPPKTELKAEFDFPPRPPAPVAFRPPPNPLASAAPLELERHKGPPPVFVEERLPPAPEVKWQVRSAGVVQGPFSFPELLGLVKSGSLRVSDEAAPLGEPFRSVDSYPLLMRELAARKGRPITGRAVAMRATPPFRRAVLLGTLGVAAAAGVAYGLVPEAVDERIAAALAGVSRLGAAAGVEVVTHPLKGELEGWRGELGAPTGTATEQLAAGRSALKPETLAGRIAADESFRKGLLTEPDNASLLAAFVENRAWLEAMGHPLPEAPLGAVVAYARTRGGGGESSLVLRAEGALAALQGSLQKADRVLTLAKSQDPSDAETSLLLALARLDKPGKAKGHAAEASGAMPGSTRAKLVLGMALRRHGEHAEATRLLEARARAEPKDALAARELALTLMEQGLVRRATRGLEVAYAATGDPATARLYALALLAEPAGQRRADSILAQASKRASEDPSGAALLALRAELLLSLGHAQQAVVVAEDAKRRFARAPSVLAALARAYGAAGRVVEARRAFAEAEPLAPGRADIARLAQARGDLELAHGERAAALEHYERSLGVAPDRVGPRVAKAVAFLEAGDTDAASLALMALLQTDPRQDRDRDPFDRPFANEPFALYHQRVTELSTSEDSTAGLVARGVTAFHAGDLRAAHRGLAKALKKDRGHPVALLYAAALDLEEGDKKSAHRRLQLLEATLPEARAPQLYLARLEASEHPEVAEARLARLFAQGLFVVEGDTILGHVAAARGQPEKARYSFRSAFMKDPSYLPGRRALLEAPVPLD